MVSQRSYVLDGKAHKEITVARFNLTASSVSADLYMNI